MFFKRSAPFFILALAFSTVLAAPIKRRAKQYARDTSAFAADPSINAKAIYSAAQAAKSDELASFPTSQAQDHTSTIYGDWKNLDGVSAIHFIADMDVDCDGKAVSVSLTSRLLVLMFPLQYQCAVSIDSLQKGDNTEIPTS